MPKPRMTHLPQPPPLGLPPSALAPDEPRPQRRSWFEKSPEGIALEAAFAQREARYVATEDPYRPATLRDLDGRPMRVTPAVDQPMRIFLDTIGEDKLRDVLALHPESSKWAKLGDALADPHDRRSFARMCRDLQITWTDLVEMWRSTQIQVGVLKSAARMPEIMERTSIDALPKQACCTRCDGKGEVEDGVDYRTDGSSRPKYRTCPVCEGGRKMEVPPDKDARYLMYETNHLIGSKKTPAVVIQQNFGDAVEDTVLDIGKLFQEG